MPTLAQIKEAEQKHLIAEAVLSSRIDAQVTTATDQDADFASEVIDGRVDTWGTEHSSLGANIREGQLKISVNQEILQTQINSLAEAVLETLAIISEKREKKNGGKE